MKLLVYPQNACAPHRIFCASYRHNCVQHFRGSCLPRKRNYFPVSVPEIVCFPECFSLILWTLGILQWYPLQISLHLLLRSLELHLFPASDTHLGHQDRYFAKFWFKYSNFEPTQTLLPIYLYFILCHCTSSFIYIN